MIVMAPKACVMRKLNESSIPCFHMHGRCCMHSVVAAMEAHAAHTDLYNQDTSLLHAAGLIRVTTIAQERFLYMEVRNSTVV